MADDDAVTTPPTTPGLAGKRALVTGAAGEIGAEITRHLIRSGVDAVGFDLHWSAGFDEFDTVTGDVTDLTDLQGAVDVLDRRGGIDICIANAGVLAVEAWDATMPDQWRAVMDVNALGVLLTFQAAAASMRRMGRRGRLIAAASAAGIRPDAYSTAYCASKAAVISIVASAAQSLAPYGITVNAVAPGEIETGMHRAAVQRFADLTQSTPSTVKEDMVSGLPLRRMGSPAEVAAAYAFLASDHAGYLTGHTLVVDGGRLLP